MALGGGGHVFGTVVAELYGMAGLHGEECGVAADDGGEVFLAAEGSAGFGLDDAALFGGGVEDEREGVYEVVGALHGAAYGHAFGCVVFGDDAVVVAGELFL